MRILLVSVLLTVLTVFPLLAQSQETGTVTGIISDSTGSGLEFSNILLLGTTQGAQSDENGRYTIVVPANQPVTLVYSFIGFNPDTITLQVGPGQTLERTIRLRSGYNLGPFEKIGEPTRVTTMNPLNVDLVQYIPSPSGNFEPVLQGELGVNMGNELSSQYSVRGGNFDENLVYVNDIQIYRPFLIRSGQQEGLSFINPDMVEAVSFSAGGFDAKYGDKMSSVLDVTYKRPEKFGASVSAGLLGASAHVEMASKIRNRRFTNLHGIRYRTNRYLLNSLDTDGSFNPVFVDYQGFMTYYLRDNLEISFLGNYSRNQYNFVPETRETDFGTVNEALRLTIFFDGEEVDDYQTGMGALSFDYQPTHNLNLKFISSGFVTQESETFDIEGAYRLDELENDLSKDNFGDVAFNRGVGGYLDHARNYLEANVWSAEHKGSLYAREGFTRFLWGAKYQHEFIDDELSEWQLLDSVGFSIPQRPSDEVQLFETIKSNNTISSNRTMGYFQFNNLWERDTHEISLHAGLRANYWDWNDELLWSPRATLSWKPHWDHDWLFRASWGYYHQPAFYREMRNLFGQVNQDIEAQTSIHYVLGSDYNFKIWNRPFKFLTELYYKDLQNLIPYEIDNVRIRYYATNNAEGYATGIDMKLAGEIVGGVDSWLSVSVMQTEEDVKDDFFITYFNDAGERIIPGFTSNTTVADSTITTPGSVFRPTDQRVNVGLFFQDYLPGNENIKMHLNLLYGTGVPTGPPTYNRYADTLRLPPYRRVDIGGSFLLKKEKHNAEGLKVMSKGPFKYLTSLWLTVEVFNLLQINNTISYLWVTDVNNRQYGVPNYLTSRRLSVRLVARI